MNDKPLIAYVAGPNATIHFSPALVTSNKARAKHGLPPLENIHGEGVRFDMLRPQRLAAPAKVYIEQFTGHPMERDSAELYAAPDGYLDKAGKFSKTRVNHDDTPVYEAELHPDDGLYMLPYMAMRNDGAPWNGEISTPSPAPVRQSFYPDGSRIVEEINRFEVTDDGLGNALSRAAHFDFYRSAPSAGYSSAGADATNAPEKLGVDFFPYRPASVARHPPRSTIAAITNVVQHLANSGRYAGILWTQGSPRIEETIYWLNLLIDTQIPIVGCAAQRGHRQLGDDGAKNIVDCVDYIASRVWADADGANRMGAVLIQEQQIFAARDVQKGDARPGGYVTTGGHGGIVGGVGFGGSPRITYVPTSRHTKNSALNLSRIPNIVDGVAADAGRVPVIVKDEAGALLLNAIPRVTIIKDGNFVGEDDDYTGEQDKLIEWMVSDHLARSPLSGFVVEGLSPYGTPSTLARHKALERAVLHGIPVVCVGRGNNEGFTPPTNLFIGGRNLTSTKARLLLMASLLRLGSLPPAQLPLQPTDEEFTATRSALSAFQELFDTH